MRENRDLWIVGGIVVVLALLGVCTCCMCGGAAVLMTNLTPGTPTPIPAPYITPIPEITPIASVTPVTPAPATPSAGSTQPQEVLDTLTALETALIPNADLHELGIRFRGVAPDTPRFASTQNPDYEVGTRYTFNVSNVDTDQQFEIVAELVYKTPHLYMWVEEGARFDLDRLTEAADLFEAHTYPTNREFFGSEWSPGIDGDPHLSILHARDLGNTVAGYFSSPDAYVKAVRPDSNEMEMFYINIDNVTIGSDFYNGVLAHEFQHMIHWNNDRNEATWLNEGCSELAMELNNRSYPGGMGYYDVGGSEHAYLRSPDTQLTTWPEGTAGSASANYGAAYLFVSYFLDRFGEDATKALVAHPENGMDSVDEVLQEHLSLPLTHQDLFADWTVANLVNDATLYDGQYGYHALIFPTPRIDEEIDIDGDTVSERSTVRQYGVDYIEVHSDAPVRFRFSGSTLARLMDTEAHSGAYLWWSNREDESDTRLTRVLDLREADEATLRFASWYHIEENWDYAYVVVGTAEGGALPADLTSEEATKQITWHILEDASLGCTETNPNGNNFGCGLTGQSNGWETLEADLTPYVGQEIALRFEYITDAAVNQSGFALDDVQVIADGTPLFTDDVEGGDGHWIAEGFVRHANLLPQEWIVQLVTYDGRNEIERLPLHEGAQGDWILTLSPDVDRAVIAVSALAPVTTEVATYEYSLAQE
jgi:hypothetical protein